jgi:hypothetical protein
MAFAEPRPTSSRIHRRVVRPHGRRIAGPFLLLILLRLRQFLVFPVGSQRRERPNDTFSDEPREVRRALAVVVVTLLNMVVQLLAGFSWRAVERGRRCDQIGLSFRCRSPRRE